MKNKYIFGIVMVLKSLSWCHSLFNHYCPVMQYNL